jgi:hypothetical protein
MYKKILLASVFAAALFCACKKETEDYKIAAISDYMPLQTGKYIIYQLDSFRYAPQTLTPLTITYQVKFQVDSLITDNLGRPAYRIYRFIRKTSTDPWAIDDTYMAVNTGNSMEFVEHNFRFLKLKLPIMQDYTWKGNSFINTTSDTVIFDFRYLDNWDYAYDSVDAPLTLGTLTLDSTVKVVQRDEINGNPDSTNSYTEINYGVEYYAKGIGMVYKKILHSEYQPPINGYNGTYSDNTKGATFTMIDHN